MYLDCTRGLFMLTQAVLNAWVSYLKHQKYPAIIQYLKLEHCTNEHHVYINLVLIKIWKKYTNHGYGNAVLADIVRLANLYNVQIRLKITDAYGSEINRLQKFYERQKFVLIKKSDSNDFMIYDPKTC